MVACVTSSLRVGHRQAATNFALNVLGAVVPFLACVYAIPLLL